MAFFYGLLREMGTAQTGPQGPEGSAEQAPGLRVQVPGGPQKGGDVICQIPQGVGLGGGEDVVECVKEPLPFLGGYPVRPAVQGSVPEPGFVGEGFCREESVSLYHPGEGIVLEEGHPAAALDDLTGFVFQEKTHHGVLGNGLFHPVPDGPIAGGIQEGPREARPVVGVDPANTGLDIGGDRCGGIDCQIASVKNGIKG